MLGHKGKLSKGATDREIEDGPGPEKYDSDLNELDAVDSIGDEKYGQTTRGLKSRHIQLIAIGGCIGTGLFVGTGATLSTVGPAPLFMCMLVYCF